MNEAVIITYPAIIKAVTENNRRIVSVEASAELVDSEGDLIEQKALMDSADSFINTGHLDLDHISEIGAQYGIPNPLSFIVGVPLEVYEIDSGDGVKRTGVKCEIFKSVDGIHDPKKNRYDEFWDSLMTDPPVRWRASIYGFPKGDGITDCTQTSCSSGATRYHVTAIDWRSLAFTKNPVNDHLTGFARIESVKSFMKNTVSGKQGICKDMSKYLAWSLIDQTLSEFKEIAHELQEAR